jgi:5-methylcytosine-specific restriction endonuclease McrA
MTATSEERSEEYVPQWRVCPLHPATRTCYDTRKCRTDEARANKNAANKQSVSRNAEHFRVYHRDFKRRYRRDPDVAARYAALSRAYAKANPESGRRQASRRRARRLENGVEPYTLEQCWQQAEVIDWCCYLCGETLDSDRWVVEHVLAIAKGGADSLSNVLPAHPRCNQRKGARLLADLTWTDHGAVQRRLEAIWGP